MSSSRREGTAIDTTGRQRSISQPFTSTPHKLRAIASLGLGEAQEVSRRAQRLFRINAKEGERPPPHIMDAGDVAHGLGLTATDEARITDVLERTRADFGADPQLRVQRLPSARVRLSEVIRSMKQELDGHTRMEIQRRAMAYWKKFGMTDLNITPTIRHTLKRGHMIHTLIKAKPPHAFGAGESSDGDGSKPSPAEGTPADKTKGPLGKKFPSGPGDGIMRVGNGAPPNGAGPPGANGDGPSKLGPDGKPIPGEEGDDPEAGGPQTDTNGQEANVQGKGKLKFELKDHPETERGGHHVHFHDDVHADLPDDADFQHHATETAKHTSAYLIHKDTDGEKAEAHRHAANMHARIGNAMHNAGQEFRGAAGGNGPDVPAMEPGAEAGGPLGMVGPDGSPPPVPGQGADMGQPGAGPPGANGPPKLTPGMPSKANGMPGPAQQPQAPQAPAGPPQKPSPFASKKQPGIGLADTLRRSEGARSVPGTIESMVGYPRRGVQIQPSTLSPCVSRDPVLVVPLEKAGLKGPKPMITLRKSTGHHKYLSKETKGGKTVYHYQHSETGEKSTKDPVDHLHETMHPLHSSGNKSFDKTPDKHAVHQALLGVIDHGKEKGNKAKTTRAIREHQKASRTHFKNMTQGAYKAGRGGRFEKKDKSRTVTDQHASDAGSVRDMLETARDTVQKHGADPAKEEAKQEASAKRYSTSKGQELYDDMKNYGTSRMSVERHFAEHKERFGEAHPASGAHEKETSERHGRQGGPDIGGAEFKTAADSPEGQKIREGIVSKMKTRTGAGMDTKAALQEANVDHRDAIHRLHHGSKGPQQQLFRAVQLVPLERRHAG